MKKLLLHIATLVAGIIFLHASLFVLLDEPGMPPMFRSLDRVRAEEPDVIYLGDSCVLDSAPDDSDRRSLYTMLDDKLDGTRVASAAHNAYHGELFSGISSFICQGEAKPSAVIIPVNLRSFSTSWDRTPGYQFEKMRYLLNCSSWWGRSWLRPLIVFNYIDLIPITQEEYEKFPMVIEGEVRGTAANFGGSLEDYDSEDAYFRDHFLSIYGETLVAEHRKLQGIVQSVRVLKEHGIRPIVYITPLDYQSADRYAGPLLLERVDKNSAIVEDCLRAEGVEVINLSRALPSDSFCYDTMVHEHLDQQGREFVSDVLVRALAAGE